MNVIYLFPTELPIEQSHGVQALNTCVAWARLGARVELIVQRLHASPEAVLAHYGIEPHSNLTLRTFAPQGSKQNRWSTRGFRIALRALGLRRGLIRPLGPGPTVFYVRGSAAALRAIATLGPICRVQCLPIVYEVHAIQHLDLRQMHGGRYGKGVALESFLEERRKLEQRAYRSLSGMVCISTRLRELMAEKFDVHIPSVIAPSGVHPPAQPPPSLDGREYDIGYIGGLYGYNGVDLLLEALAQLPDTRAAIVGGGQGDELAALRTQAERLGIAGRVTFTGHVPHGQAQAWMRRAKLLVAPLRPSKEIDRVSWCSPGKIVEYMAAGGAVVASRLPNLADLLEDGRNAILCSPNDPSSMAEALRRLLADPLLAQQLATRAQADSTRFTFEARARVILSFLNRLNATR